MSAPAPVYLKVAVPLPVHALYTYASDEELPPGTAVVVPYRTRELVGWVVETCGPPPVAAKHILRVLEDEPAFTPEQLALYRWMAEYYLAPLGEVIASATPSDTRSRTRHVYNPTDAGIEAIAGEPPVGGLGQVLREIVARPGITRSALERKLSAEMEDVPRGIAALLTAGLIRADDVVVAPRRDLEVWVVAVEGADGRVLATRSVRARETLAQLVASGPMRLSELPNETVRRLEALGAVRREERPKGQRPKGAPRTQAPRLNAEQVAAIEQVFPPEGEVVPRPWLLHGVTGAGKTEVYLALAAQVVALGQQVLVLVPEIALTPQLTARFDDRFPGEVAVLHSALTGAERLREWRKIRSGAVKVAVGARSAVFAPFVDLGLIVVDEEHDDSYKQEDGVRYHARDVAVVRAKRLGCPVVLGSATPSLETWTNARSNRYGLLTLRHRATARPVPQPTVVDMRLERPPRGRAPLLSAVVRDAIQAALDAGGKAILLYNRRGYATFVECPGCGQAYDCPSCGVSMVYHQGAGRLDCHYCGFHRKFQRDCPKCGTALEVLGQGTERVEEVVSAAFPGIPIARMDADTTSERGSHAEILERFRSGDARLLVGTQIVAKGHDFPDVHVAAVLGCDHILGMPDFRSAERCFSLVTQLCGRAGRGEVPGQVFLQTAHPEHPVFSCIGDMTAFSQHEERIRRMLRYPPFARLVLLRCEGVERDATLQAGQALADLLQKQAEGFAGVDVLGPAFAALPKLVGRFRVQVVLRGREIGPFRKFLNEHHTTWTPGRGVRLVVDVDPRGVA